MPICCRISDFKIQETTTSWEVMVEVPLPPELVDFRVIFQNSFPGTGVQSLPRNFFDPWRYLVQIPKSAVSRDLLSSYFGLLRWTVTISGEADETHALYLHTVPHPTNDPYESEFRRTKMGELVYRAKSYSPTTGSRTAAAELSGRFKHWIKRHPRYLSSDIIVPAPPGNPNKAFDLTFFIADHLSKGLGLPVCECLKAGHMEEQKGVEQDLLSLRANVSGKFQVRKNLSGRTALVIDDLYQSGETVNEIARACRAAGANSVLALAATKTAKFCNGLTPSDWYDVSMEAGEGLGR
jgi:hypothetical protein